MKAYQFLLPLTAACLLALPAQAQDVPDDSVVVTTPVTTSYDPAAQQSAINALTAEVARLKESNGKGGRAAADPVNWGKHKPFFIGYENVSLTDEDTHTKFKSQWSFALGKRRTYYVGPAVLNMLRFGIDASWMDMTVSRFEKGKGINSMMSDMMGSMTGNITGGNYGDMNDYFDDAWNSASDNNDDMGEEDDFLNRISLGKYRFTYSLGVGPSVRIAPFSLLNNSFLNKIKVAGYFHWTPGFQMLIFTGDDEDPQFSYGAMMRSFNIGMNISIGRFGIGVEHRWGKSKMSSLDFGGDEEEGSSYDEPVETASHSGKMNYKHSLTRFYIGIAF